MSFFAVTIETIESIEPHFNADKLEVVKLQSRAYPVVVLKNKWQVGDKCLYFPVDAILPENIQIALGVQGRLAGSKQNRIKSVNIRGIVSQGLIGPLSLIADLPSSEQNPEKITEFLQVSKYEPEIPATLNMKGTLLDLQEGVGIYDIENSENYQELVNLLMDYPVAISEKIEGSHIAITANHEEVTVSQRRFKILNDQGHLFWETAIKQNLTTLAQELLTEFEAKQVTIRGEIIGPGIQCNIYRLKEHFIVVYDIAVNQLYLNHKELLEVFKKRERLNEFVPVISSGITLKEWLQGRKLPDAATGLSVLPKQLGTDSKTQREGIVIKPMEHLSSHEIGRVILKQISPEYLVNSEA